VREFINPELLLETVVAVGTHPMVLLEEFTRPTQSCDAGTPEGTLREMVPFPFNAVWEATVLTVIAVDAKLAAATALLRGFTVVSELVRELEAPLTLTKLNPPTAGVTEFEGTVTVPKLFEGAVLAVVASWIEIELVDAVLTV
jgi:hypothetical protein